jgi:hypothetical protein
LGVSFELILVEGPVEEFFDGPFVAWLYFVAANYICWKRCVQQ